MIPRSHPISQETESSFIILTCMSFSLDTWYLEQYLRSRFPILQSMNAWIIRNAGGRVTNDVIRSVIIATRNLGARYCFIIHHTCCGLYKTGTNEDIRQSLSISLDPCYYTLPCPYQEYNRDVTGQANQMDFLSFDNLHDSVLQDINKLRQHPLVSRQLEVRGLIYDDHSTQLYDIQDPHVMKLRCQPGTSR